MKTIITYLLFSFILVMPSFARTWTSSDGRTIEADIVSTGADFVVLRLATTGATATVKYSSLIAADVEYAKKFIPSPTENIILVINKFPKLTSDDESGKQLFLKYEGFVKIMTPATAKAMCEMVRKKLPEDVRYWKEQSERQVVKPKVLTKSGASVGEVIAEYKAKVARQEKVIAQAKANHKWLSTTIPQWLSEVEKAAP